MSAQREIQEIMEPPTILSNTRNPIFQQSNA